MTKYGKGKIVRATVTGIEVYGIFVSLDEYYSGLIHISEISEQYVKNVQDYVNLNEKIKATEKISIAALLVHPQGVGRRPEAVPHWGKAAQRGRLAAWRPGPDQSFPFVSANRANGRSPIFALAGSRGFQRVEPFGSSSFLSDIFSSVEEEKMPS